MEFLLSVLIFIWKLLAKAWDASPTFYPAFLGVLVAITNIKKQRQTSREKNSLDFEAAYKRNEHILEAWYALQKIYANRLNTPVEVWGEKDKSHTDQAKALKIIFNEWERCANAVHHQIYDDQYLYKVYGSTVIHLDINFDLYIKECQKNNPRFYYNFKILALKWRVRRAYEDLDSKDKKYLKRLKKLQKNIDTLIVKY